MTWSLSMSGHVEGKENERAVLDAAKALAEERGASSFSFGGNYHRASQDPETREITVEEF